MRRLAWIGAAAVLVLVPAAPSAGQHDPSNAVFLLVVVRRDGGLYQPAVFGTAFFIHSGGIALTNSHVVYLAGRQPERYALLAVVGREFYSASIICASRLRQDPAAPALRVPPGRDVAKILLAPSIFPFQVWRLARAGGEPLLDVTAHRDALPRFPVLNIAGPPESGGRVHVIGFAHLFPGGPRWAATGEVLSLDRTTDGTEIFGIDFTGSPPAGNSGSPVLNTSDEVVGMWTWYSLSDANVAMAISSRAFRVPCL